MPLPPWISVKSPNMFGPKCERGIWKKVSRSILTFFFIVIQKWPSTPPPNPPSHSRLLSFIFGCVQHTLQIRKARALIAVCRRKAYTSKPHAVWVSPWQDRFLSLGQEGLANITYHFSCLGILTWMWLQTPCPLFFPSVGTQDMGLFLLTSIIPVTYFCALGGVRISIMQVGSVPLASPPDSQGCLRSRELIRPAALALEWTCTV